MRNKTPLRDRITAVRNYPGERWRRRTVRNVLVAVSETRRNVASGFEVVNHRLSQILERMEASEEQHAQLLIHQGIAFGRELPPLVGGNSSPPGHLEGYFDAHARGAGHLEMAALLPDL